jgi:hypothetical protein
MLRSVDWGINTDVSEARNALNFGVKQAEDCKDYLILKIMEKISLSETLALFQQSIGLAHIYQLHCKNKQCGEANTCCQLL